MTLLICYGNPGRGDDALGPEFAKWVSGQSFPGVDLIVDFQLKVEHAISVSAASRVLFVDSTLDTTEAFTLEVVVPSSAKTIDSHSLYPASVLNLARLLFGRAPPAHVLAIGGFEFGHLSEGLSRGADRNLAKAKSGFLDWLRNDAGKPEALGPYGHAQPKQG